MNAAQLTVMALALAVLVSALGVVYSKHHNRALYVRLHTLQLERDAIDVEWGQLQLEQNTLATQGRIERLARKKLNMQTPEMETVVMVK